MSRIHEKAIEAMEAHLRAAIDTTLVSKDGFKFNDDPDHAWKFAQSVSKECEQYIERMDAYLFFLGTLYDKIDYEARSEIEKPTLLPKMLASEKIEEVVQEIIQVVKAVPIEYEVLFSLKEGSLGEFDELKFSDSISIFRVTKGSDWLNLICEGKSPSLSELFERKTKFNLGETYLKIRTKGFAAKNISSSAVSNALNLAKQFLFVAEMYGALNIRSHVSIWGGVSQSLAYYLRSDQPQIGGKKIDLDISVSNTLSRVEFSSEADKINPEKNWQLANACKLISKPVDDADYGFLKTATQWGFDAKHDPDETSGFVKLCIAIEAALGSPKPSERGLTEALAERCAFITAKKQSNRKKVRDEFVEFYDARSRIMHGNLPRLDEKNREYKYWGQTTLRNIVHKEIAWDFLEK